MKLIIGINGLARHGKDTTADFLLDLLPGTVKKISYAEPVKGVAKYVFGLDSEQMETTEGKLQVPDSGYGMTVRELLQKVGTESFRDVYNGNIWLDWMDRNMDPTVDIYLKSDVRFLNEIKHTKEQGKRFGVPSYNIKIVRQDRLQDNQKDILSIYHRHREAGRSIEHSLQQALTAFESLGYHRSEFPWPDDLFDKVFLNDGTLQDLQKQIISWVESLGLQHES